MAGVTISPLPRMSTWSAGSKRKDGRSHAAGPLRGEHFSDHSSAQHTHTNIAGTRRLMTAASARQYRDLLGTGLLGICANMTLYSGKRTEPG
jgi:hypothetical protein